MTQDIALEVILRVVFGLSAGPRFTQLKALIVQLTDIFLTAGFALALFQPQFQKNWNRDWRTFLQIKQQMSHLIYLEIRDRRQHQTIETSLDILSLLLQAQDEKGEAMSDQELHDELITLLLAGHETTATVISWALYWIHRDRRVRENLLAELNQASTDP